MAEIMRQTGGFDQIRVWRKERAGRKSLFAERCHEESLKSLSCTTPKLGDFEAVGETVVIKPWLAG
jgi:hypothetical protein